MEHWPSGFACSTGWTRADTHICVLSWLPQAEAQATFVLRGLARAGVLTALAGVHPAPFGFCEPQALFIDDSRSGESCVTAAGRVSLHMLRCTEDRSTTAATGCPRAGSVPPLSKKDQELQRPRAFRTHFLGTTGEEPYGRPLDCKLSTGSSYEI